MRIFRYTHGRLWRRSCEGRWNFREAQDEWAYRSHQRAVSAHKEGRFEEEIVPVTIPQRKGDPIVVAKDEAPREDTTIEKLAKLKPVFDKTATVTAGNAPGLNDGGAALVLMSEDRAKQEGRKPLATILAHTAIAVESKDFPRTPGYAINALLEKQARKLKTSIYSRLMKHLRR